MRNKYENAKIEQKEKKGSASMVLRVMNGPPKGIG